MSDNVAILNHGKLVAQAPINELMAGNGAAVYTMTVVGDGRDTRARLAPAPWVTSITASDAHGTSELTTLQVAVTDARAAEASLLRLALEEPATIVTSFGRKQHNLEEVFMNLVEGGPSNGR